MIKLSTYYYIQIYESKIRITDVLTQEFIQDEPLIALSNGENPKILGFGARVKREEGVEVINPFSHPRTLLSNFDLAAKVLQHFIKVLNKNTTYLRASVIFIQPMEKNDGGFTQIEKRAFRELAMDAGARSAIFYEGSSLPIQEEKFLELHKKYLQETFPKPQVSEGTSLVTMIMMAIVVVALGIFIYGELAKY